MGKVYRESYTEAGYRAPTPFINVAGRPVLFWLIDNLSMQADDRLYIVLPKSINLAFAVDSRLQAEYPMLGIFVIELQFQTRGPLETLLIGTHGVEHSRQTLRTLSLDCDTIYFGDILQTFRNVPAGNGCSFYSDIQNTNRNYSYIKLSPDGKTIVDIREKAVISKHANTGAYGFSSAVILQKCCEQSINTNLLGSSNSSSGQEFYLSSLIKAMISEGFVFDAMQAPLFACVGSPKEMQQFIADLKHAKFRSAKKLRIAFDLIGTLLSYETSRVSGSSTSGYGNVGGKVAVPNEKNIMMARQLKQLGHTIIVWSSEGMQDG